MEQAFNILKSDFLNGDVDFKSLSKFNNNFIIDYHYGDTSYFKRALFELDKLNLNIGVHIKLDPDFPLDLLLENFINNIKGFKINLGVWIDFIDDSKIPELFNKLSEYKKYFIIGCKMFYNDMKPENGPIWYINGDIESLGVIYYSEYHKFYSMVNLNTDYKTIYNENNLVKIPSTYKI